MAQKHLKDFFERRIKELALDRFEAADKMGVKYGTLGQNISRGKISANILDAFLEVMEIDLHQLRVIETLDESRTYVHPARPTSSLAELRILVGQNILPLIKLVAESRVESMTFGEFLKLAQIPHTLHDNPKLAEKVIRDLLKKL
jgi:hypothetical protein